MLLCTVMLLTFTACGKANDKTSEPANMPETVTGSIVFKDFGEVEFELYLDKAQNSALNFIYLAQKGHYDGIIVHRISKDFVIQAGAYESGMTRRDTEFDYTIKGDFSANGVNNPIGHVRGTLSWARANDFNSASTQFFICVNDATAAGLDGNYAPFGMITDGFEVLDEINEQPTASELPIDEVVIESVTIDSDYKFPEPEFIR